MAARVARADGLWRPSRRLGSMPRMDEARRSPAGGGDSERTPVDPGHPRGTLAIVAIFGLLFALGWLAMYLFRFLGRGAPQP